MGMKWKNEQTEATGVSGNGFENPPWRRRRTLVDPEYQLGFALRLLVTVVAVVLVHQGLFQARLFYRFGATSDPQTEEVLGKVLVESLWTTAIVALIAGVLMFGLGVWFSHRLVGPLPRLREALHAIARGQRIPPLRFRPGDLAQSFVAEVNEVAVAMQSYQKTKPLSRDMMLDLAKTELRDRSKSIDSAAVQIVDAVQSQDVLGHGDRGRRG
jgi:hypothetical protein